jgi:hypothetical protein
MPLIGQSHAGPALALPGARRPGLLGLCGGGLTELRGICGELQHGLRGHLRLRGHGWPLLRRRPLTCQREAHLQPVEQVCREVVPGTGDEFLQGLGSERSAQRGRTEG